MGWDGIVWGLNGGKGLRCVPECELIVRRGVCFFFFLFVVGAGGQAGDGELGNGCGCGCG